MIYMPKTALLLSIKPRFADAIFAGTKTIELRRVRPRVKPGDLVLVYVSAPRSQLEGAFLVESVLEGDPRDLWPVVGSLTDLTLDEYENYFSGAKTAFGIQIRDAWILPTPVDMSALRNEDILPPQSYRYLNSEQANRLGSATVKRLNGKASRPRTRKPKR